MKTRSKKQREKETCRVFVCGVSARCWWTTRVKQRSVSPADTVKGSRHLQCISFNTPAKVKYLNILHVQVGVCVWLGNKALLLI